jgi:two-component system phosphate regulon sensor histidine kinase PhoR
MSYQIEQSFTAAIPFPAVVIGANERIETANDLAIALFGDQVIGQPYVTALRQPGLLEQIDKSLTLAGKNTGSYTATVGQNSVIYDVHIAPIGTGLLLTFIDTTDAIELDSFRRDFVANVSHELRTPLASVLGFVETLRGHAKNDPDARERFLEIIERETQRMSALVDDLLSLSSVEEEERKKPTTLVEIHALVTRSISELKPVITAAKSKISLADQSAGAKALADADQMHQVISNLVENALRYGDPAGLVSVKISEPAYDQRLRAQALHISITNTGKGIAAHHIPRLTERFYRVDSHRSREVGGTGLGLAIVKHIVQRHRGRLHIESTLGIGSTFTVILPVAEENSDLS